MTITANTAYNTYNNVDYKTPVYYVEMSGSSDTFSTHALGGMKAYLHNLGGFSEKITTEEGKSSIGNVNFSLQDTNDEITALFKNTKTMRYNKVTLYGGYKGMSASDFVAIWSGRINNVKRSGITPRVDIQNLDIKTFAKNRIWTSATAGGAITAHGNPIDIVLQRLLSSNTAGLNSSAYDLGDGEGLNLGSAWVDIAGMEDLRDGYFPTDDFFFRITEGLDDAKKFFEDEICRPLGMYIVIRYDGKITLRSLNPPLPGVTPTAIDESNFAVTDFDYNYNSLINNVVFEFDYKATGSARYKTTNNYVDTWSLRNWGERKPPVIKCRGIHGTNSDEGDYGGDEIISRAKDRMFRRFADPKPLIMGNVMVKRGLTEVGDVVALTHTKLPDPVSGSIGISGAFYEVTQKNTDFKRGKIKVTMLGTGYDPSYIYGLISPSSTIATKHSASAFTLHDISTFEVPQVIAVQTASNTWGSAAIAAIAGNKVTLAASITPGVTTGDIFQFADWTDQTKSQRDRYGSLCDVNPTLHCATGSTVYTVNVNTVASFTAGSIINVEDGNGNYRPRTVVQISGAALRLRNILSAAPVSGADINLFAMTAGGTAAPYRLI
jgi:hypothetical protein